MERSIEQIKQERIKKLKNLQEVGIEPYPQKSDRDFFITQVKEKFSDLSEKEVTIAGRVRALREHGKLIFFDLEDETGKIQCSLRENNQKENTFEIFLKNIDIGDFLEIKGSCYLTKTGEETVEAKNYKILSKALLPLPEKWHGLKDKEERFRKRYLDLLFNPEVKERFILRSKIVSFVRSFLDKQGFLEVETPILQQVPGGATAKPFKTHLNALALDLYLRVAPELYLKRLLVGGFEKVYELGRNFRNEGVDFDHNPEFTMLEFYWAYQDYEGLMDFTEKFLTFLVKEVFGKEKIKYEKGEIDFKPPWPRLKYIEVAKTEEEFKEKRKEFINPVFVTNHPLEISPLAKKSQTDPAEVSRFQVLVGGRELVNAYSELNDPLDQKDRFKAQEVLRKKGDEEAQRLDEDFIEALEYGMPPAAGFGMGIDRLTAILTSSHSLREIIFFPLMRPK